MANEAGSTGDAGQREQVLTVARVRERAEHADVMFFESARIYRLARTHRAYESVVRLLREAVVAGTPVRVRLVEAHGDVIEGVRGEK